MQELSTSDLESIAVSVLGPISWIGQGRGYLECPGKQNHNNKTGRRDCMITLLPGYVGSGAGRFFCEAPTISCFHDSCADIVAESNHKLRSAIGKAKAALKHPDTQPGKPKKAAGLYSRTDRTDKITVRKKPGSEQSLSRTIRTLPHTPTRIGETKSQYIRGGSSDPSDRSEPVNLPPGGPASVYRLCRTTEKLPRGTIWIDASGDVYRAARTERTITIGRKIATLPKEQ